MDSLPWPGPLAALAPHGAAQAAQHGFTTRDGWMLFALFVVLVIAALASASETALTSVPHYRIRIQAAGGDERAQLIQRLHEDPNVFLTTILVINNVAVIIATTLSTVIALDVFKQWAEVISTVVISLIVLVLCEITPKTAAVQNPERWARWMAPWVNRAAMALRPLVIVLTWLTDGMLRVFGAPMVVRGPFLSEAELRAMLDLGEEQGVIEEEDSDVIRNVFELRETTAREVMVPRIDMVMVAATTTPQFAVDQILQGGQSRIPVYSDSIDNVIGVLYAKDLLRVIAMGQRVESVRTLVRPAYFVPETKRADDLLHEMQQQRVHMAIVTDEYGQVAGLVTIEDLVEEIIGDIQDEYDREEVVAQRIAPNEYIVDAKIGIDDFNDLLDARLPSADYDTLAGFLYAQLDKIPTGGDRVTTDHLRFTVLGTKGRRITKVRVERDAPPDSASDAPPVAEALPERDDQPGSAVAPGALETPPASDPAPATAAPTDTSAPGVAPPAIESARPVPGDTTPTVLSRPP
ncbi:MAG TPA: CNNM domain-containing protein, partial [Ktedonobacterales bacterium]|nr:CNNM domain-containing protein [Ktedonobacterales bacterium]